MKYKFVKWFTAVLILSFYGPANTQDLAKSVKGKIRDRVSFGPLAGANIVLTNTSSGDFIGTESDDSGEFSFYNVKLGRYSLSVSYIGYQTFIIPELQVIAARDNYLDIQLEFGATMLEEVVVDDVVPQVHISMLGKQPITVEQTLRYAATFFDPARLSTSFPGVSTINDQNNNIVVRGNSPNGVAWRLEGIDLVNPNHLTNAGTFSDRPVQSGGSVNILSSQLLGTSDFLNGAFDATYGNALSGVFDMKYRNGSSEELKLTTQLSLLGLDFAAEGPINSSKTGSFIVNYRYSTIGLLSAMGIDLGDEAITFQDISFHVNNTSKKGSTWSVFGLAGKSSNDFMGERDSTLWEYKKDRQDIFFDGAMLGLGLSNKTSISGNSYLLNTVGYSILNNERSDFSLDSSYNPVPLSFDESKSEILSWRSEYSTKLSSSYSLASGFHISHLFDEIHSSYILGDSVLTNGGGDSWMLQPYINFTQIISPEISYNLGLRYMFHTLTGSQSIEPRVSLKWQPDDYNSIYIRYGKHSMLQTPGIYYYSSRDINGNYINPNVNLDFTKSHHIVLGYDLIPNETLLINAEIYYQDLFNVPVSMNRSSSFSVLNQIEGFVQETLQNSGKGRNYGMDFMLQKTFSKNMYYLANISLYESKYKGSDGIERDTRFNGNYAINFTGGKEFNKKKTESEKTFGFNISTVYLGGYRDTPIDVVASENAGATVYFEDQAFTVKMKDYFRLNVRLSWSKNRINYTRTLSLDIQNITNRQNIAYSYYDAQVKKVVEQDQLGIIPILAYRIEF